MHPEYIILYFTAVNYSFHQWLACLVTISAGNIIKPVDVDK